MRAQSPAGWGTSRARMSTIMRRASPKPAAGCDAIGGRMTKRPKVRARFGTYYFQVEGITAAVGRITAAGGTIINGPMEVPGGSWIVQALDPQGAMFALVGPKA